MADKTRIIDIYEKSGTFTSVFRRFTGAKQDYNYDDLSFLRQLLSNEKARLMHVVKVKKPKSIYQLAKFLERDFKSVREDLKLLQKFGFIELIEEKDKNRINHRPILTTTNISILIRI